MDHQRNPQSPIVLMLVTAFLVCCGAPVAQAPPPPTVAPTAPTTTITEPESETATAQPAHATTDTFMLSSDALKNNLLGDPASRPVQVILPPGYATSKARYPVVYFLHGFSGDPDTPMLDKWRGYYLSGVFGGPTGDLVADLEQGVQVGDTQPMILVFPNASTRLGGSWYRSSATVGDYETYLVKELVDYVDSHYRTLPQRDSRGIAGCSMGGYGAAHLGLTYPDVYAVVAAQSGPYFLDREPTFLAAEGFAQEPTDIYAFRSLPVDTRAHIAAAAVVAPNPEKPPFYLDMPYVVVDGKAQIAPGYIDKLKAFDTAADVERYLAQPVRLNALLVQHSKNDDNLEPARDLDRLLTEKGIAHEFDDSFIAHCSYDHYLPMLKFMSDHLVGEGSGS